LTGAGLYAEIQGWQGLLGSALGFGALTWGALYNFKLNRRRDMLLRSDEARSVAAALYGEILLLRGEVAHLATATAAIYLKAALRPTVMKFDQFFIEEHRLPEATLFKALAPRIGLLEPNLVLAITAFHKNCHDATSWIPMMSEAEGRGYSWGPEVVLRPARAAVHDVIPALRAIEAELSISVPAPDPPLGQTDTVIGMIEEEWTEWSESENLGQGRFD
jgi:hypothetical protein